MSKKLELLYKAMGKRACNIADKNGFSRIEENCYLYDREFLNTEYIKTQGTSKYVLLIDSDMLGISGSECTVLQRVMKRICKDIMEHNQKTFGLIYQGGSC